jgi:hypothetical protein
MDKLNGAIYTIWYTKDKEELGSGHTLRQISLVLVALHYTDTLVKHGQANPYTRTPKTRRHGFSLASGSASGKAFFPYTREVFASKWAREDFPCN